MIRVDDNVEYKYMENDVVIIHKPLNVEESPTWVSSFMDEFDGRICHIKKRGHNKFMQMIYYTVSEDDCGFSFNEKWLEPYEDDIEAGDISSLFE